VIRVLGLGLPFPWAEQLAGYKQLWWQRLFADLTVFLKRSAARSALQKPLCYRPFAHLAYLTDLFRRLVIENRGVVGRGFRPVVFSGK
jgi:hypothetical protein